MTSDPRACRSMPDEGGNAPPVLGEFAALARGLASGRYAVSIGGSRGKGTADAMSDIDFRLWADEVAPPEDARWREVWRRIEHWATRGVRIDSIWARRIAEIDAALDRWLAGQTAGDDLVWTVWGYHLPTDVFNQQVIEDPHGILAGWHERLRVYPPALKRALLARHLGFLRYWRNDYHYANKARRGDAVFLAGLSSKLVHSMMQVLFALNETYYAGDGNNLVFLDRFRRVRPANDFAEEVAKALYPPPGPAMLVEQRDRLIRLIDQVERLAAEAS